MQTGKPLQIHRRLANMAELADIPWLNLLSPSEHDMAVAALRVGDVSVGEYVCRVGRPVTYWFGVVEGLLKMSSDSEQGIPITFTGRLVW
jgi:CRP/FNR family transcriptional regulator, cyclic AMP receptor protein